MDLVFRNAYLHGQSNGYIFHLSMQFIPYEQQICRVIFFFQKMSIEMLSKPRNI